MHRDRKYRKYRKYGNGWQKYVTVRNKIVSLSYYYYYYMSLISV